MSSGTISRPVFDDGRVIDVGNDEDFTVLSVFGVNGIPVPPGEDGCEFFRDAHDAFGSLVEIALDEIRVYEVRDGVLVRVEFGHQPLISFTRTAMWSMEEMGPHPEKIDGSPSIS